LSQAATPVIAPADNEIEIPRHHHVDDEIDLLGIRPAGIFIGDIGNRSGPVGVIYTVQPVLHARHAVEKVSERDDRLDRKRVHVGRGRAGDPHVMLGHVVDAVKDDESFEGQLLRPAVVLGNQFDAIVLRQLGEYLAQLGASAFRQRRHQDVAVVTRHPVRDAIFSNVRILKILKVTDASDAVASFMPTAPESCAHGGDGPTIGSGRQRNRDLNWLGRKALATDPERPSQSAG
jgi:hypothetical protein